MKDVNGGYWGLMIILSAFMIQFITYGVALSFAIYNIELLQMTENAFSVSLVSAINIGVFLGSSPVVSVVMKHMSHRKVVLTGAGLSSASILCMPFLPSIEYMYAVYGVGGGFGFSLAYIPSYVLTGLYYDKHRSLATGIAKAGSGLGLTILPVFTGYLIKTYTWRPSLFVVAGLTLNLFVLALLLRPLPKSFARKTSVEAQKMLSDSDGFEPRTEVKKKILKHFYIFYNISFDVYFVSIIIWSMGMIMFLMFGPDFLTTKGLTNIEASFMLTVVGFCRFLGSLLSGAIGNIPSVDRLYLYVIVCVMCGTPVLGLPFVASYPTIVITHVFIGLGSGGTHGLLAVLIADVVGSERLGDGVGYIMLGNGAGGLAGPALAGALKNSLGTYDVAFYTGGTLLIVSGVLMVLVRQWSRFGAKKTMQ